MGVNSSVVAGIVLALLFGCPACGQEATELESLQTVAESSDFKSTCRSQEVVDFLNRCDKHAQHVKQFVFGETVEQREMVGVTISKQPYQLGDQDERVVALVIGNIHSGECAGKEALLMMVRELAMKPDHPWLEKMVLIIVPNYNADANDRIGKNNRPGQIGPVNGMGRRENAQNLDLNRDFVKLESPEARSLVGLIDKANPHLFIDCHTTNGSKHQYQLTYDIPHNPATAKPIRSYLRNKMLPKVTEQLKKQGTRTFYYGNFNREHTSWTTYGYEPRYSTEYVGLRGRLAILSEAYSYITYKERIEATKSFVSTCFDFVRENSGEVHQLLASVDQDLKRIASQLPSKIAVSLNARLEKFDEKFPVLGYKDDQPHTYECEFFGEYVSTRNVPLPYAYVIPARLSRCVDRLLKHGIVVEQVKKEVETNATIHVVKELNRNERVFQKHKMLQAQAQRADRETKIAVGSYVVRTAQPLGRLVTYLLECESDDGFVFWNFLDRELTVGGEYPIVRIENPIVLATEPVTKLKQTGKLALDMIGGENSLLPTSSRPRWVNGKYIETELYGGRKFLLDPSNMSFVQARPAAFEQDLLVKKLVENDISEEDAGLIAELDPHESEDRNWLVFDTSKHDVLYDVSNNAVQLLGTEDENAELFNFSPDQKKLAFVNSEGLNVLELASGRKMAFRPDNPATELLGKLDWVYQEELYGRGNFKGYWFSPDSDSIAFLKLDESGVGKFTITDHIPVRGEDDFLSYPKAGDPNPKVAVGMAKLDGQSEITWVDLSDYDSEILISNVSWRPDSSQLILQVQNRQQTYLDLAAVDKLGTKLTKLFQDKTPAWIDSPGEPRWLKDGGFVWLSPRNGYKHLYHFKPDGQLERQLTSGEWEVRSIVAFDQEQEVVYFSAAKEQPYNLDIYRTDIHSIGIKRLTSERGFHSASFNEEMSLFIDSVSTSTHPTRHQLVNVKGEVMGKLAVSSDDRIDFVGISEPEYLELASSNAQPLDAMIVRPPNFDPNKKYPVLIHAYAGPQSPTVRSRFGGEWELWHQLLAQQGYVIWKCDNQSASYRSAKNAWPIHEDLGRSELADIERGVEWLKQQPWVDGERIGIWGWSYGGYITAYALTHSESFKIGISGAPVTDWRNYDTIYTERYMGLPSENREGYDSSSVVKAAGNLSGKLLLIHGSIDDNVHLGNTMQLVLALQKAGKQFDLMIYPKNQHAIRKLEQAKHLRKLMHDFVIDNL